MLWSLASLVDTIHDVVFVDGIHVGHKAIVLIPHSQEYVLGWYVACSESSKVWKALIARIVPRVLVVTDGGAAVHVPCIWPDQTGEAMRPMLAAPKEQYALKDQLPACQNPENRAKSGLNAYLAWCVRGRCSSPRKPLALTADGSARARFVRARNSVNCLVSTGLLFTFPDPIWQHVMSAMNNLIERATNALLRQMLRDHRGVRLMRRIKAIFWWCYMHTGHPVSQPIFSKPCPPTPRSKLPGNTPAVNTLQPGPSPNGATSLPGQTCTTLPRTPTLGTNPRATHSVQYLVICGNLSVS